MEPSVICSGPANAGWRLRQVSVCETLVAVQKSKDFNEVMNQTCMDDGHGNIRGGKLCEQVAHDRTVATRAAGIAYGLGAAFAVTGVILHAVSRRFQTSPMRAEAMAKVPSGV